MIDDLIQQMRKNNLRPREEVSIKDIFKTINEALSLNKDILNRAMLTESGMEVDIASLQNIFSLSSANTYGNTSSPFINDYGRVSENMTPYGIVGVKVDKKISLKNYLEIIKVCIETRNSIILKPFMPSETLKLIVKIINGVLKQTVDFNEIALTDVNLEKEDVDILVYVGTRGEFGKLTIKKDKIFLGIGQYELIVDEIIDEKMIEFAKNNGVKIYHNYDKVYDDINENGGGYCTAIMSGNREKIREFISRIKSSYALVNMSPTLVDNANLFPEQLLKRKTTIIYG